MEISKPCLSSKRHSVISQSITNNNIVSNDVNNGNNDRLESKINSMSKNYCIVVQKEFEQTCDKNHSQVNYTKTMTLQKNLITDDSLISDDLNMTGFISLPNKKVSTKKVTSKLPTSPSMPLPNLISTDHYIYNVNLSEIDHYSEPYNSSSTCESLIEYKQTDKLIMDHQNDPELTMKLDRIACEIGLLHDQRRIRRESSLSSQYDIDGLMSINSPCSESNLPKADLDQLLTLEISTTLSNPAYVSSSKNDTTTVQTISTSLNNSKIADSRHRTHLSRVDSSLTNANKLKSQSRPNSTGSRIIKEFLRHISPKLGHSLSRISSRKKSEYQKSNQDNRETNFESPQSTSTSFERCKSERIYPKKSLLRFIPRCSSRSKERKTKQISTTEAEIEQQFPSLSHNHHRNQYYSRYYENDFNQHPQSRPASIALPVGNDRNDEISFPTYNQLQTNRQINLNNIPKIKEFDHLTSGDHPAIKSKTPPIKRRNTALAIKAKSAKLKQPLNVLLPVNIRCHNKLSTVISKTNEMDCIQLRKKEELTTFNNNNTPSDNLSTLFCSTLSGSTRFDEIDESMKRLSSSSNELYNHSDIVHNNDNPFECIKNSEINTTHLELSINNDRDYVMNLLKYAQTFECQLMNVINLAKGMVDQNNHPINDDLLDSTNENLNNDELLTGIGHIQMLINGNLTMLRKLCKVYLEANSNIKKQQSIEYIPLKSDLEGYWNLILLQYKRLETQFPILKLSGANKNNKKSIDLHITIQQRIRNARKQMLEKQKNQIIVTKENDIDEQSTYKNTYFYTIEY
ncbi:Lmp3-like protein [Schistosoma mansoni]|uniref:Lmp3-like protein n=1 Tax=Schistosoma mansoni TaxID=6183 RepID=UPI0001A6438A|nr:Lmp3-like protein [Schistosoma mansoni]|eukprot:XP_018650579.1 Lmp3-like protein [Schistosoma mansoni]